MSPFGYRLQLFIGATLPAQAPAALLDALDEVTITLNDRERDGFQLRFAAGKGAQTEYALLSSGALVPLARVVVAVFVGPRREVLIDGLIADTQLEAGDAPGSAMIVITGEDLSLNMDLKEKRRPHPQQSDSEIVQKILLEYNLRPMVERTDDKPLLSGRQPSQHGTDLAYVRALAAHNGFTFYVEPTAQIGEVRGYWGPPDRRGQPQRPLSINFGADSTVESLSFRFNALGPVDPLLEFVGENSREPVKVQPRAQEPPLAANRPKVLRSIIVAGGARMSSPRAMARILGEVRGNAEAVTASGELDAVRYGDVLRARRLVGVRGAGLSYDGLYYVRRVTHTLRRGSYRQRFELAREGLGARDMRLPL